MGPCIWCKRAPECRKYEDPRRPKQKLKQIVLKRKALENRAWIFEQPVTGVFPLG
jgi:hypothetical protein